MGIGSTAYVNAPTVWHDWVTTSCANTTAYITTDGVWQAWVGTTLTATGGGYVTADVWPYWCASTSAAGTLTVSNTVSNALTVTVSNVWPTWCAVSGTQPIQHEKISANGIVPIPPAIIRTPKMERREREERERYHKWEEDQKNLAAARLAAREKSKITFMAFLAARQREQFVRDGSFELSVGERIYRIRPGSRVEQIDPASRKVLSVFCIHHRHCEDLPEFDTALHQKLLLEADEAEFRRIANETRIAA